MADARGRDRSLRAQSWHALTPARATGFHGMIEHQAALVSLLVQQCIATAVPDAAAAGSVPERRTRSTAVHAGGPM
jgi:hypothetical protein